MKNYLDKMVFKPDYLVKYNEEDNTYVCKVLNENATKTLYINGYAASKSHPDEPVLVSINIPMNGNIKNAKVYKLDHDTYLKEIYNGKHDLFIYALPQNAILAGKEMALYDEADRYVDMCKDIAEPLINRITGVINNPLYRRMGQGFAELLTQKFEKRKKEYEPTYNKAKETAKKTYDKAKETVKTSVDKLFNEIQKPNNEKTPFWCETEQCALYRELTDTYAVTLKHRKNQNGSKYSITIFNLSLGSEKLYYITQEQFHDIYEILNEKCDGQLKFNSIMDVIADLVNNDMNSDKKTKPIQQVEFHKQDVVEEAPTKKSTLFTHKFKIGDSVRVNDKVRKYYIAYLHQIGTVVNITGRGTKTLYVVKFSNGVSTAIHELYSNELDKVEKTTQNKTAKVGGFKVIKHDTMSFGNAINDRVDELNKRFDDHDKVLNTILDTLKRIDKTKK